jgi:outer membrane receptor for ferrienterochelin and colicin
MGGLDAKYGNAQSGVVIFRTKEGGERFSGEVRYQTDDYGSPKNTFDNYDRFFLGLGGPMPVRDMTYYVSGEATYSDDYPKTVERRSRQRLLDFISVGDRKNNSLKLQGKLAYRPSPNHKLTFELIRQESRADDYYHMWNQAGYVETFSDTLDTGEIVQRAGQWSPTPLDSTYVYYNAAEHTPNRTNSMGQYKLVLFHQLSQHAQYSVRVSTEAFDADSRVLGQKEWEYAGERDRDFWANYRDATASSDFSVISGDNPFLSNRSTRVYRGLFDLTWRRGKHTFEGGLSGAYNDMRYFSVYRPYLHSTGGQIGSPREQYHYYNPEGAAYVQDRWEHEGMILNAGVRYDVFSVGDQVAVAEVTDRIKGQLSPRVGVGYPISDRDLFSFHYGRLYQIPDRQYIFDNRDSFDGTRGNPNLSNETTIQYQAAIQHLFSELLVGQFSVYYKDIYGLITATQVDDWASTGTITTWVNRDYASSKGFEVSLVRGFRNYMRWEVSYTYGVALGVGSDPSRRGGYLASEQPLDWDVRHSVGVSLSLTDRRTWGVHLTWDYMTGSPYTPQQRDTRTIEPEMVNSRRLPSETTLNVRADKYYTVWGKQLSLFVDARNVLDARNIGGLAPGNWPAPPVREAYVIYYTETGRAGGAYLKDLNGDGVDDFVPLNDPRVFSEPRTVRVGVGLEF